MNQYDHYVAVDWAQRNMAIARMTNKSGKIKTIDVPSDIGELKVYLKNLKGTINLTFEETDTAQWLYTELSDYADKTIVCDPYRNKLLSEGPKTDRIDAQKLVRLLRADLLKEVFHTGDDFIYLRKIVSGYGDVVKAGVRLKNQRSALFRARGKSKKDKFLDHPMESFVLKGIDRGIESYEREKSRYEREFHKSIKKYPMVKRLKSIPGIGLIGAVKTAAIIIDPARIKSSGRMLSYCGLIRLDKISGGRSYGSKRPRYSRELKAVFKTAALSVIQGKENPLRDYYEYLIRKKGYADYNARHKVARRIALIAWGVLKSGKNFDPRRLRCNDSL